MEWELAASLGSGASFGVTSGLRSAGGKPLHLCITAPLRRGFVLVTTDFLRSRDSVAIGNPPRFAWATPSVASRVGSCPTVCGGRRCGRCPCPTPLPIGSMASISIKGEGCARHPHPFGARPAGCAPRAASGVALDADSSQDTAASGDAGSSARSSPCHHQSGFLAFGVLAMVFDAGAAASSPSAGC